MRRESASAAPHPVWGAAPIFQRMQGWVVHPGVREIVPADAPMPDRALVGGHVHGIRRDGHGSR